MWKVSWLYEKVSNIVNFGGYAAILLYYLTVCLFNYNDHPPLLLVYLYL